jgi:Helix-turn-helix domain of resolvase
MVGRHAGLHREYSRGGRRRRSGRCDSNSRRHRPVLGRPVRIRGRPRGQPLGDHLVTPGHLRRARCLAVLGLSRTSECRGRHTVRFRCLLHRLTGTNAKGRLRGKPPKLKPNQAKHLLELHDLGTYSQAEIAELFGVGRSTVYRTIERMRPRPPEPERPFVHFAPSQA